MREEEGGSGGLLSFLTFRVLRIFLLGSSLISGRNNDNNVYLKFNTKKEFNRLYLLNVVLHVISSRVGMIHRTHDPIRFDTLKSEFYSIRFNSNEYIIVVNRYSINHCVPIL